MATTQQGSSEVRRSRGRPRDPRVEGVVLDATRDLLVDKGFGRLTIAAVADSAGVGKGTIYLRWPDKESLVVAALADTWGPIPDPDTGSLRGDLVTIMRGVTSHFNGPAGKLFASVIGELGRYSDLRAMWMRNVVQPWSEVLSAIFERAIARGEMRTGIDLDRAVDSLMGPVLGIGVVRGQKISATQSDALVDLYLNGAAA